MKLPAIVALAVACIAMGTRPATAGAQSARRMALDVNLGIGHAGGGIDRSNQALLALDGVLALRSGTGRLVLAAAGGMHGPASHPICPAVAGGSCGRTYPDIASFSALGGLEWVGDSDGTRLLAGPAYYRLIDIGNALGLQARADLAIPVAGRFALVLSARGDVMTEVAGESFRMLTGAAGLRFR